MKKVYIFIIIFCFCTEFCYGLRPYLYYDNSNNEKARFIETFTKFKNRAQILDTWMKQNNARIETLKGNEEFIAWVMVRHLILDNVANLPSGETQR